MQGLGFFAIRPKKHIIDALPGVPPQFVGYPRVVVEKWLDQHEQAWVKLSQGAEEVSVYNPERRREVAYTMREIKAVEQIIWGLRAALKPAEPANGTAAGFAAAIEELASRSLA